MMSKKYLGIAVIILALAVASLSVTTMWTVDLVPGRFLDEVRTNWIFALFISGLLSALLGFIWVFISKRKDLTKYPVDYHPLKLWYMIIILVVVGSFVVIWVNVFGDLNRGFEIVAITTLIFSALVFAGVSWILAPCHLRRVPFHFVSNKLVV